MRVNLKMLSASESQRYDRQIRVWVSIPYSYSNTKPDIEVLVKILSLSRAQKLSQEYKSQKFYYVVYEDLMSRYTLSYLTH